MDLTKVLGFILNIPSRIKIGSFGLPFRRKHWTTVRAVDEVYYDFDSKYDSPEKIGSPNDLLEYLKEKVKDNEVQLLIVCSSDIEASTLWKRNGENLNTNNETETTQMNNVASHDSLD